MKNYLVDLYQPPPAPEAAAAADRAHETAEQQTREGTPVTYVRSLIPEDETCLHLFEGVSADAIGRVSRRAALDYQRIVEMLPVGAPRAPTIEGTAL